jgi:soluble lytic murein transglycosylase
VHNDIQFFASVVLFNLGYNTDATSFLVDFIDTTRDIKKMVHIIHYYKDLVGDSTFLRASKQALRNGFFFIDYSYPLIRYDAGIGADMLPLVYTVISRESNFDQVAISPVGAMGLMQIMPPTAKNICKQNGIQYSYERLTKDANYNVTLGSIYIKDLLGQFDYSYPLTIAAYNAGPNAVKKWMRSNEYPENNIDDAIDWIELITYKETRNYVMRVMENETIYRYLLIRNNFYNQDLKEYKFLNGVL